MTWADEVAGALDAERHDRMLALASVERVNDIRYGLLHGTERVRVAAARCVMDALWGTGMPPRSWWTTPVGRAVILAGPGPVSGYRAAQALGVTPGYIGQLVRAGVLERPADGRGVTVQSLRDAFSDRVNDLGDAV